MHAVNAFAKLFQKTPRTVLSSQLEQMFGQPPCMVPVCTITQAAAAPASPLWPQMLRTVAEGASLKGFPVRATEASLDWERRVREAVCHPENTSAFHACQVSAEEQVRLLETHILRNAPGITHNENLSAAEKQHQNGVEFSMKGAPLKGKALPVYIAVAGFDQGTLIEAFLAALRNTEARKVGLAQSWIELMIKDVKKDDLHLTIWHKNGLQRCDGFDRSGTDNGMIQCVVPSEEVRATPGPTGVPEVVEQRAGEMSQDLEVQKNLNWHTYGCACMQLEGEEVPFLVHGFDLSERCAAARVEVCSSAVLSCMVGEAERQKDRMHVTLWTLQGVRAREAGELRGLVDRGEGGAVHLAVDQPLRLKGTVSLFR
jgi:hypothetical protein